MRRIAFIALGAVALCAVAFSPGPEVALALTIIALGVIAVPWLKTLLTFTSRSIDILIGHGHVHLRADGLGAGGRHGPPRSIFVLMLAVWTAVVTLIINHFISAGGNPSRANMSAQPLPS